MKKILILILAASMWLQADGCDICGCSLGGNYFGILPLYSKNFVGLRWSQAKFTSSVAASQYLAAQYSEDTYSKVELWGRYYLAKRVQLFGFLPYVYNYMSGTDQVVFAHGLGDINIIANYVIVDTGAEKADFKHIWIAGGGIKLPTGKYDLEDKGKIINRNFQMGTGSIDFNLNTVYTVRYKKIGANLETGYKINTLNRDDYLFGNQVRASGQIFAWLKAGSFSLLPHGGLNYEQAATHKDGEIIQVNTGGWAVFGSGGFDVYVNRFTAAVNYQHPISQNYNSDESSEITSKGRWTVSLLINF